MRENHPYFDSPLFVVGRESRLRHLCQHIVYAKYTVDSIDPITGKPPQRHYKQLQSAFVKHVFVTLQWSTRTDDLSRLDNGSRDVILVWLDALRRTLAHHRRESHLQ